MTNTRKVRDTEWKDFINNQAFRDGIMEIAFDLPLNDWGVERRDLWMYERGRLCAIAQPEIINLIIKPRKNLDACIQLLHAAVKNGSVI